MKPPETHEVKDRIHDVLDVQSIKDYLDPNGYGDDRINVMNSNFEDAPEPQGESWSRLVIMDKIGLFNIRDYEDKTISHEVYIRCDTMPPNDDDSGFEVDSFLQRLQTQINEILKNQFFNLDRAKMIMPLSRVERSSTVYRSDRGFYYNGSTFKTFLASYE